MASNPSLPVMAKKHSDSQNGASFNSVNSIAVVKPQVKYLYFPDRSVGILQCNNFEITDEQFLALNHLEKMKVLEFSSTDIGNRGFSRLNGCSCLVELVMNSCLITGPALENIKGWSCSLRSIRANHQEGALITICQ